MNEQLLIYLWSISEQTSIILVFLGIVILIAGIVLSCNDFDNLKYDLNSYSDDYGEKLEKITNQRNKRIISSIMIATTFLTIATFIPSKQDLALIFTYPYIKQGAEKTVQSETAKKLYTISTKYLDKIIKDLEAINEN